MRKYKVGDRVLFTVSRHIHSLNLFKFGESLPGRIVAAFGGQTVSQPPVYRIELDKCWPEGDQRVRGVAEHMLGRPIFLGSISETELATETAARECEKTLVALAGTDNSFVEQHASDVLKVLQTPERLPIPRNIHPELWRQRFTRSFGTQ